MKIPFETHDTIKLFYDEYLYKVTVRNALSHIFRDKNLTAAKSVLDRLQQYHDENMALQLVHFKKVENISNNTFFEAKNLYVEFLNQKDYKLRIENPRMQIYSNDITWLKNICTRFDVTELWRPADNISKFEKNVIYTDTQWAFEYKVKLGDNVDPNLAEWIVSNPDKAKAGKSCLQEIKHGRYVKGFYIYVKNEKILQLLSLFIGKIQRVDKLVYIPKTDK